MGDSHALRQAMRKVIGEAVVKTMLCASFARTPSAWPKW